MPSSCDLKLICLNTWAGMAGTDGLLSFFTTHRDTDLFCLQEIWNGGTEATGQTAAGRSLERVETHLLEKLKATLPDHRAFYTPHHVSYFGIAIFAHTRLTVVASGEVCIYREPGYVSAADIADHCRILQYVTLKTEHGPLTVMNVHAAWQPVGKIDTPERLEQSHRIINFTQNLPEPLILCGDFNLLPDTTSLQLLERAGWENLIRTHGITSTRTSHYRKPERFADYVFIKNGIHVRDFRVLPEEISDHAPLFLECSLHPS